MENNRYEYSPIIYRKTLEWPQGARLAVWLIPNIEHFEIDLPAVGIGAATSTFPDVMNYSWRDYGVRVGIWRLMEVLDKYNIRATVALNAAVCDHYPAIIEEGKKRSWEFMGHGLTNSITLSKLSPEDEKKVIVATIQRITKSVGQRPQGWLGPSLAETFNTPDLLAEQGIRYLCDWCNDDQPYPMKVRNGTLLSIPYSIEINDIPVFLGLRRSPEEFYEMIRDQFDVLYADGAKTGRVMAIALHPFIIGQPFRIKYLDQALQYITGHKDIWFATGSEIANWYYDRYV